MGWEQALMAAATAKQYSDQKEAANDNANIMGEEGAIASASANSNYAARLRKNTELMGSATAAAVQSGGGVGGSTKGVLDQNAIGMELDALNEKYQGNVRRDMFAQQAGFDRQAGDRRASATAVSGVAKYLSASNSDNPGGWSLD